MKRFLLTLILIILTLFLFPFPALAQEMDSDNPTQNNPANQNAVVYQESLYKKHYRPDQKTWTQNLEQPGFSNEDQITSVLDGWMHWWNNSISGKEYLVSHANGQPIYARGNGAIQLTSNYISYLVTQPPTSSVDYLADINQRLKLVPSAYAQDDSSGYQGLDGIMSLWKGFRNLAYAVYVLIFVIIGFMIMFRTKLNPQTAVTLQLALPKLIITLLLITFSYAIAGLIIDLTYFSIYLAVNLVKLAGIPGSYTAQELIGGNFFSPIQQWIKAKDIVEIFGDQLSQLITNMFDAAFLDEWAGKVVGDWIAGGWLAKMIIGIAILYSLFKLFFQLIIAYLTIILQIIFAPIILLLNAFPNTNTFSSWLKNIVANAAAFPAVAIVILIGYGLTSTGVEQPGNLFTPPMLNFDNVSLTSHLLGFGLILILPKIVTMIQEALKAKPAMPIGGSIVEGLGVGWAPIGGFFRSRREARLQREQAQFQAEETASRIAPHVRG